MDILVAASFPWPAVTGARLRTDGVIQALASIGDVHLFATVAANPQVMAPETVQRLSLVPRPNPSTMGVSRLTWALAGRLPREVTCDFGELRSAFQAWAQGPFDLAWWVRAFPYVALRGLVAAPSIVDLDDLEDRKIVAGLKVAHLMNSSLSVRDVASRSLLRLDARRWRALQKRIAAEVQAITVCSELDESRLGGGNIHVIPNGYQEVSNPVGRLVVSQPPTVLFPGFLAYGPNLDGARYLVEAVYPRLRARIPGVRVRLAGRHDGALDGLDSVAGVTVTGEVPNMLQELARADLIAVPIRFGSGTRIKIIEAFAHRIPVVSTSIGCEGLEVRNETHLLVADDAEAFAAECARALTDIQLRADLGGAAHRLFVERYRWQVIHPRITELAYQIASRGSTPRL